jgi:hypothetical protein
MLRFVVTFAQGTQAVTVCGKHRLVCIRLLRMYITAVYREGPVWSYTHLAVHDGHGCRSKRFLGSGLVGSLKMYH